MPEKSESTSRLRSSKKTDDLEDTRYISPQRTSNEERMSAEARSYLENQAKQLQSSLLQLVERVEDARVKNDKLEGENRFLQSYIGELMQTSKLTASKRSK